MAQKVEILLLEDREEDARPGVHALQSDGGQFVISHLKSPGEYLERISVSSPDIVLASDTVPGYDGFSALEDLRKEHPDCPFILLSTSLTEELALRYAKYGADDCLSKERISQLPLAVKVAIARRNPNPQKQKPREISRLVEESMSEAFFASDSDGLVCFANPQFYKLFGLEDLADQTVNLNEIIPPEHRLDKQLSVGESERAGGDFARTEFEVRRKDGQTIWLELRTRHILENGKFSGYCHFASDITGIKKAEVELLRSESFGRGVLASLKSHIAVLDGSGFIISVNDAWRWFAEKGGAPDLKKTGTGRNYLEVCERAAEEGDEHAEKALNGILSIIRNESNAFEMEYPCHTPYQKMWFLMRVCRMEGQQQRMLVVHEDISNKRRTEMALKEREESWRTMLQNLPGFVYQCTPDKNYSLLYISQGCEELTGYSRDEFITEKTVTLNDLVEPAWRNEVRKRLHEAFTESKKFQLMYPIRTRNGEQRWLWEKGQAIYDENNEIVHLEGFVADFTERKKAEDYVKIRLSLEQLHVRISEAAISDSDIPELLNQIIRDAGETLSTSRAYIFEHNHSNGTMDNIHEWCNDGIEPQIESMQGVKEEDVEYLTTILKSGEIISVENTMSIPDEGVREMFKAQNIDSVLAIPIFLRGRYFGFLGFDACNGPRKWSRDDREALKSISHTVGNLIERKISEKALREESARLDNIIRGANLGTWEWNLQTNQVKYNDRWAEMIGYLPEELDLNRVSTWRERTHPADIEKSNKILQDHINGKTPFYECELRMRHKAGHWIWIRDKGKIISYTTDGKPEWMFGTHSDITEAKRTEKELLQKNIELQKRNTELDRFVYSTSHDLRSPLASLLGLIAIADSNTAIEQEEQKSIFRMMEKSVKRLDGFIGDILDYSRNSRQEIKTESISFKELVEQQLDDVAHLNGTVDFEIKENVNQTSDFFSDKRRVKVILNNLLSNAVKYLDPEKEKPMVWITINVVVEKAEVTIRDNGIGIEKKHQEKVFEMFYRGTSLAHGSGLGLYIARESADKLNGKIHMESEPGKGTEFYLVLPNLKIS